jgi:CPA1 family monovalent cation:H+ antiporter
LRNGNPFPARNIIIFFTFCVILVTLVFQGLTFPFIIRKMGLAHGETDNDEGQVALRQMLMDAMHYIQEEKEKTPDDKDVYEALERAYKRRLALLKNPQGSAKEEVTTQAYRYLEIARAARNVERHTAALLLDENRINDLVYQQLILDIDLQDARFNVPRSI